MLYLNDEHMRLLGVDWNEAIGVVEEAARLLPRGDYAQPVKPYLRYNDPVNRIIAMPAYIGGSIHAAGIKWIASFPGNLKLGLPRAHNVTILNDPDTGRPIAVLNTAIVSMIRTAAVSGLVLTRYLQAKAHRKLRIGILGWGPIGRTHLSMLASVLQDRIAEIKLFDIRGIDPDSVPDHLRSVTKACSRWNEAYEDSDIVITCTVAADRYIDAKPAAGSLLLHVSLRDYKPEALDGVGRIIVDDWEEVCRENTDIELLSKEKGLREEQAGTIAQVVAGTAFEALGEGETVLFAPMGIAVFDIAVASSYVAQARRAGIGTELP